MTFLELSENILYESDKPLTPTEVWKLAIDKNLDQQLDSKGKTPWATLGARLYVDVRDNKDSVFMSIGKRPKRFYLRNKNYNINFDEYESGKGEEETSVVIPNNKKFHYFERDLHPFLAHFAFYRMNCYTKTINHSKSGKKEFGEWVHPDMTGCVFPIDQWDSEVLHLSSSIGNTSVRFISFELKRELNLSTLREYFFQTVSNSTWANESYIVAADISDNEDFLSELSRLSVSFGIGVIKLDINDPNSSEVLYPAQKRQGLDWETINKLTMNKDFKEFIKRVRIDLNSNEIRKEKYDKILNEEMLLKSLYPISANS